MRLLLASFFLGLAFPSIGLSQATVTQTSLTVETATIPAAGSVPAIVCVFNSQNPQPATGVQVSCTVGGANQLTQTNVVAGAGVAASFNPAGGQITWLLWPSFTSGVNYSIAATPTGGAAVTKNGAF